MVYKSFTTNSNEYRAIAIAIYFAEKNHRELHEGTSFPLFTEEIIYGLPGMRLTPFSVSEDNRNHWGEPMGKENVEYLIMHNSVYDFEYTLDVYTEDVYSQRKNIGLDSCI